MSGVGRVFLLVLLLFIVADSLAQQTRPKQTFFVTISITWQAGEALEVRAEDRIWASLQSGITVWTEKEWKECEPCRKMKVIKLYVER